MVQDRGSASVAIKTGAFLLMPEVSGLCEWDGIRRGLLLLLLFNNNIFRLNQNNLAVAPLGNRIPCFFMLQECLLDGIP